MPKVAAAPKCPNIVPKWLNPLFQYAAANSRKRAQVDACMLFPAVLDKHWESFRDQMNQEWAAQKKPRKEKSPEAKAENAVKNLAKTFADVSPDNKEELVKQVQDALGVDVSAFAVHGDANVNIGNSSFSSGPSEEVKTSVQNTLSTLLTHLDSARETLENMQKVATPEENPLAQPLILSTANFIRVVQQGMDEISNSLHLAPFSQRNTPSAPAATPQSGGKRRREDDKNEDAAASDKRARIDEDAEGEGNAEVDDDVDGEDDDEAPAERSMF